jgi:hypothetical protein
MRTERNLTSVIPAQGEAGISIGMPIACVTVTAYKRLCALQGGIQVHFYEVQRLDSRLRGNDRNRN